MGNVLKEVAYILGNMAREEPLWISSLVGKKPRNEKSLMNVAA